MLFCRRFRITRMYCASVELFFFSVVWNFIIALRIAVTLLLILFHVSRHNVIFKPRSDQSYFLQNFIY